MFRAFGTEPAEAPTGADLYTWTTPVFDKNADIGIYIRNAYIRTRLHAHIFQQSLRGLHSYSIRACAEVGAVTAAFRAVSALYSRNFAPRRRLATRDAIAAIGPFSDRGEFTLARRRRRRRAPPPRDLRVFFPRASRRASPRLTSSCSASPCAHRSAAENGERTDERASKSDMTTRCNIAPPVMATSFFRARDVAARGGGRWAG